jgi:hypothetical protein
MMTNLKIILSILLALVSVEAAGYEKSTLWIEQEEELTFGVIEPGSPAECVSPNDVSRRAHYSLKGEPNALVRIVLPKLGGLLNGHGKYNHKKRYIVLKAFSSHPVDEIKLDKNGRGVVFIGACREKASKNHEEGIYQAVLPNLKFFNR